MHFTCRSFIGACQGNRYTQYWENEPDDPFLIAARGHLFGLIDLASGSASDEASNLTRQLISQINQRFFSSPDTHLFYHLKDSLAFLSANPDYQSVNLALAIVHSRHLYLATFNQTHCLLKRNHQISRLLVGQSQKILTLNGPLQAGDLIFLCNDSFFSQIGYSKIKQTLSLDSVQKIEENTLSALYSLPDQIGLAAALIQTNPDPNDQSSASPSFPESSPSSLSSAALSSATPSSPHPRFSLPKLNFFKKLFSKKTVYVPQSQVNQIRRRKKTNILIASFLLLALLVSSYLGFRKNQAAQAEKQFQQLKTKIEDNLKQAQTIKNLSLDSAQQLAQEAQTALDQLQQLQIHSDQIPPLKDQVTALLSQTGSASASVLQFVYDTSLITSQPHYQHLLFAQEKLYLLDTQFGRIDYLSPSQKSYQNVSISDDLKTAIDFVFSSNNIYILTSSQISLVGKTITTPKLDFSDVSSFRPLALASWNQALYILDSQNIYKTTPSGSQLSPPLAWLKGNQSLPDSPSALAINGKIWVLSASGQLVPYLRGQKDNFNFSQQLNLNQASHLAVAVDSDFLIFADGDNIIYVVAKDGQVKSKYNLNNLTINDIALDEASPAIYILAADQKIYQISL